MPAIIGQFGDKVETTPANLECMLAAMAEAGAGENWTRAVGTGYCLGQSGRAGGARSISAAEDGLVIVADARIDGRDDVCRALGDPQLSSDADDTDLILAAWRKWGSRCPEWLIGDYAFAILDPRRKELFAARDHAGARPFLYSELAGSFVFASDAAALLALPGFDTSLDDRMVLTSLLSRHYFSFDRTFHSAVRKLPPGHSLQVVRGQVELRRYWKPGRRPPIHLPTPEAYAARLRELVESAVADRLRDVGRLGVHLSGGLDSSAVAALAVPAIRAAGGPDPIGFSWHHEDPEADPTSEPGWTEAIRAALGIELVATVPDRETIAQLLRRDWTRNPDPRNLMHESMVQRAASSRGVDVILSGWGGDQAASFEGRGYHAGLLQKGRWRTLWRSVGPGSPARKLRRVANVAVGLMQDIVRDSDHRQPDFAAAALRRRARPLPVPIVRKISARRTMFDLFEKGPITSRLETWASSGARVGIEYRYPLLDRRILDFCYAIPDDFFHYKGVRRWLFRTAMADLLPDVVKRHASKLEPVRGADIEPETAAALKVMATELRRSRASISRSDYVDLDRLQAWLDAMGTQLRGSAPARIALQLLDFPEPPTPDCQTQAEQPAAPTEHAA